MLADADPSIRIVAAQRIIKLRSTSKLRQLSLGPKGSFACDFDYPTYKELAGVVQLFTDDVLLQRLTDMPLTFPDIPCQAQAVEKAVQDTSKMASKATSDKKRQLLMIQQSSARQQ
ncbi:hypothetical protein Ciccas_011981 [Cichlidogyrus casuarinus]|uniref:Uncharacterized protein n=1 Tax=Cichlidogyrus casuarinus TaxID=1844966 RepID=A0ABD2PPP1_9PLAT